MDVLCVWIVLKWILKKLSKKITSFCCYFYKCLFLLLVVNAFKLRFSLFHSDSVYTIFTILLGNLTISVKRVTLHHSPCKIKIYIFTILWPHFTDNHAVHSSLISSSIKLLKASNSSRGGSMTQNGNIPVLFSNTPTFHIWFSQHAVTSHSLRALNLPAQHRGCPY